MWLITAWQRISPEVTLKNFKKYFISSAVQETDGDMLWNTVKRKGMLVSVRKMKP